MNSLLFALWVRGGGELVIAVKGKRDINIRAFRFWFKSSKNYINSFLSLSELEKALKIKMEEINQS